MYLLTLVAKDCKVIIIGPLHNDRKKANKL